MIVDTEPHAGRLTLLDRHGRLWIPTRLPGLYAHDGLMRTERQIADLAEPVIDVHDPRVLTVALTPAERIRLNDLVVLPGKGELSPVIGVFPDPDSPQRRLFVCSENGDWARRAEHCLVLRADPPAGGSDPPPRMGGVTWP